jgi:hypothetical protein
MPNGWYLAESLVALRSELDKRWPDRDRKSDGSVGDVSHQARVSDHNPDWRAGGVVRAIDIDKDGIDAPSVLSQLITDSRVEYVIHMRKIYSRIRNYAPAPYSGINAHMEHIHVSLRHNKLAETDTSRWLYANEEELMAMDWEDEIALTEIDAKYWNEWGKTTKYKKGSKVKVGDMLRYPTLMKRMDLKMDRILAALEKDK